MKSIKLFFFFFILFIFSACCDDDELNTTIENCEALKNAVVLEEEEKAETCIYFNVYRYKSEIYRVAECCICDQIYMAIDCEGNNLCELDQNCMDEFYEDAEYLFAIKDE